MITLASIRVVMIIPELRRVSCNVLRVSLYNAYLYKRCSHIRSNLTLHWLLMTTFTGYCYVRSE